MIYLNVSVIVPARKAKKKEKRVALVSGIIILHCASSFAFQITH